MCGADDCPRCFPNHFYKGRYIDLSLTDEEYEKFKDDVDDDELEEKLSKCSQDPRKFDAEIESRKFNAAGQGRREATYPEPACSQGGCQ